MFYSRIDYFVLKETKTKRHTYTIHIDITLHYKILLYTIIPYSSLKTPSNYKLFGKFGIGQMGFYKLVQLNG